MIRPVVAAVGFLVIVSSNSLHAEDWPQWRGPLRSGHAAAGQLPEVWPAEAPPPKWRSAVGIGYSSPVVADGRVFVMGRDEDGNETCLAFNAETGERLWRIAYPEAFAPPDPTAGRGPNSTPTVDGDRVYMFGLGGMLHCIAVESGEILWKHDCRSEYWGVETGDLGDDAWFPVCGCASSALVVGRQVIFSIGGKKAGAFTAFDRDDGSILWKTLDDRGSYASPLLVDVAGRKQYIGFTATRMVGFDSTTHELLWEYPFEAFHQQTIVSPVV